MTRKIQTRNKIMKVALKLFSEQGYYATPTKLIAQEAGINEITLFRHFGSKEKLFQETTETYVKDMDISDNLKELDDESFEESIKKLSSDYLQFCFDNKKIYKIQLRLKDAEKEFVRLKLSRAFSIELKTYFERLIAKKVIKGNPELMAVTLINSILGAYTIYLLTDDSFSELSIENIVLEHANQFASYYKI